MTTFLPPTFCEWWFAPWEYAAAPDLSVAGHPVLRSVDRLALRDGYRLWCGQTGVIPDLPEQFDAGWGVAVTDDLQALFGSARLFAGIIAVREQQLKLLDQLPFSDRKWCASVASTQPLKGCAPPLRDRAVPIETLGLLELACRLELDFPGLWSRLYLLLPPAVKTAVTAMMAKGSVGKRDTSPLRAQRCWRLCRERYASGVSSRIGASIG